MKVLFVWGGWAVPFRWVLICVADSLLVMLCVWVMGFDVLWLCFVGLGLLS